MPHRAGYFVLAYNWDHHCQELVDSLKARKHTLASEVGGLAALPLGTRPELRRYFETWSVLAEQLDLLARSMERRVQTIDQLGFRGYGVNRDLQAALRSLIPGLRAEVGALLERTFATAAAQLPKSLVPADALARRDVPAVLAALPAPRGRRAAAARGPSAPAGPAASAGVFESDPVAGSREALARYEPVMKQTPWVTNTAIFQKLFLQIGTASSTLQRGRSGFEQARSPQELKVLANRNFLDMYRESFASLHQFTEVGIGLLKRIHHVLSRELDADAGNFRTFDFPDRNGVTFDHGNFDRELRDLEHVLRETGQSFHDTDRFLWDLARSYYMFIGVHPFRDSNGRVGRTFLNHMLLKKGIPPISFHDEEEVFALPRYGGTMEDMHAYLRGRIARATEAYLDERARLHQLELYGSELFNVSFDSGLHFRQIGGRAQKLEVAFHAYVCDDGTPLAQRLIDECRVVLPSESLVRNLALYCGFAEEARGEWKKRLPLVKPALLREVTSDRPGARAFELSFVLELTPELLDLGHFTTAAVCPGTDRVFSNKGLYFSCRLDRRDSAKPMGRQAGEQLARPTFKWIGEQLQAPPSPLGPVAFIPGGVGLTEVGEQGVSGIKVVLDLVRSDGARERFFADAVRVGSGHTAPVWQTHKLPLYPFDSVHGALSFATFSYIVYKDGRAFPSQRVYKFATLGELLNREIESEDFHDPDFAGENPLRLGALAPDKLAKAYAALNDPAKPLDLYPLFTRGAVGRPEHPVNDIHRCIDWVIERARRDPKRQHTIKLASYDFDNAQVCEHLLHARREGVFVECIADYAALCPPVATEATARLRRAGIPILGIVRNTPLRPHEGIQSMHAKFILFDDEIVQCSSYNLHFHLWGGNWENAVVLRSKEAALLFESIWLALKGQVITPLAVDPLARCNVYYSFGDTHLEDRRFQPQDAIITEINHAQRSLTVCMFDIGSLPGRSLKDAHETDVITALINARNRGVDVKVILNGQIAHTGPLPATWDKDFPRPVKEPVKRLQESWIPVSFVYYHESVYSPVHHKFAVIDDETVLTGSYNWYEPSLSSDEILLVLRDRALAAAFEDEANRLLASMRLGR